MKKITALEKQRIFGKYITGTFVYSRNKYPNERGDVFDGRLSDVLTCSDFLQLLVTPLSDITDEDALEVANMLRWNRYSEESKIHQAKELFSSHMFRQTNISAWEWLGIFDFLRSRGYATPCAGFTIDQLVEAGIFNLKNKEG